MPTDVERLFRIIAPALVLLAGCGTKDGESNADVVEKAPAHVGEKDAADGKELPEPSTKKTPADVEDGGERKLDPPPEVGALDPEPKAGVDEPKRAAAALMGGLELGPKCPSGTWCTDKRSAKKNASRGSKYDLGCAEETKYDGGGPGGPGPGSQKGFSEPLTKAKRDAGITDACCYSWYQPCPGGRPLLDNAGKPVVAPFETGLPPRWSCERERLPGSPEARAFAARAWLEDAAMEHASVASFGRVALELLSLGAPPELVEGAHLAALDEIRHAKTCLSLARACGAVEVEPGRLAAVPQRSADFARFAADTFIEGCVGETIAALVVTRAAAGAEDPGVRRALEGMAADEARHAALAWKMVSWAIEQGGAPVLAAIHEAADRLRPATSEDSSAGLEPDGIDRLGRLGARELARARREGWMGIVDPMLLALQTPPIAA